MLVRLRAAVLPSGTPLLSRINPLGLALPAALPAVVRPRRPPPLSHINPLGSALPADGSLAAVRPCRLPHLLRTNPWEAAPLSGPLEAVPHPEPCPRAQLPPAVQAGAATTTLAALLGAVPLVGLPFPCRAHQIASLPLQPRSGLRRRRSHLLTCSAGHPLENSRSHRRQRPPQPTRHQTGVASTSSRRRRFAKRRPTGAPQTGAT